jgi:hypothetical protein
MAVSDLFQIYPISNARTQPRPNKSSFSSERFTTIAGTIQPLTNENGAMPIIRFCNAAYSPK